MVRYARLHARRIGPSAAERPAYDGAFHLLVPDQTLRCGISGSELLGYAQRALRAHHAPADSSRSCGGPAAFLLRESAAAPLYVAATSIGFLSLFLAGLWLGRLVKERLREDPFNDENESFMQETRLIENEYSAKIPLSRMISPQLYWAMTGNDFTLDINNPEDPKILCVGNNPDRQNIYSAALGLYNSRITRLINK